MQSVDVVKRSPVANTFRNARVFGMFDIPMCEETEFKYSAQFDLPENWQIGLIVGPSGSGKTSIAENLFGNFASPIWDNAKSLVDNFPSELSVDEIIGALQGVGLSSPKTYVLPYNALSNGQKFRADLALSVCSSDFVVYDEFTSVVDRIVAKAACVSTEKTIRRMGKKFVGVSCHYDIVPWIQPDWVFDTDTGHLSRDCLRRPRTEICIEEGKPADWKFFSSHHYLSSNISPSAKCYICWAKIDDEWHKCGFFSTMPSMGRKGWRRGHRTVIRPDFQGMGIGNKMIEAIAQHIYDAYGLRFGTTTSAPQIVKYRIKRPSIWRLSQAPMVKSVSLSGIKTSAGRLTTSWEYIPTQLRNG